MVVRGIGTVSFVVSSVSFPFPLPFFCALCEGGSYPASFLVRKGVIQTDVKELLQGLKHKEP